MRLRLAILSLVIFVVAPFLTWEVIPGAYPAISAASLYSTANLIFSSDTFDSGGLIYQGMDPLPLFAIVAYCLGLLFLANALLHKGAGLALSAAIFLAATFAWMIDLAWSGLPLAVLGPWIAISGSIALLLARRH